MEVIVRDFRGHQLKIRRPHGLNIGLALTMSKGDGEPPVIDMELSQDDAKYLADAIGLFS